MELLATRASPSNHLVNCPAAPASSTASLGGGAAECGTCGGGLLAGSSNRMFLLGSLGPHARIDAVANADTGEVQVNQHRCSACVCVWGGEMDWWVGGGWWVWVVGSGCGRGCGCGCVGECWCGCGCGCGWSYICMYVCMYTHTHTHTHIHTYIHHTHTYIHIHMQVNTEALRKAASLSVHERQVADALVNDVEEHFRSKRRQREHGEEVALSSHLAAAAAAAALAGEGRGGGFSVEVEVPSPASSFSDDDEQVAEGVRSQLAHYTLRLLQAAARQALSANWSPESLDRELAEHEMPRIHTAAWTAAWQATSNFDR